MNELAVAGSGPQSLGRKWNYGWPTARADLLAGLTVAAISLPQSIAYALIAGVDPRFGLYTAIVFTAIAGLLGSSRHLVNGPTGAVSLVVFSALAFIDSDARLDAYEAMFLLAVMVGMIQIGFAVFRLGDLTRYISESVVTGFIAGAAFLTIIGQVANALGLKALGSGHQHVLYRLWLTLNQSAPLNVRALAISLGSIVLAVLARALVRRFRLPQLDMFVVLLLASTLAWLFGWSDHGAGHKPTLSLIEAVPPSLPQAHIPTIQWHWLLDLSSSAFAIATLGLRGSGDSQGDRSQDTPVARLQPAVSCGRRGQSGGRLLSVRARIGFAVAYGHQLPGRGADAIFGRVHGTDRCVGGADPGTLDGLCAQSGPGGPADRRRCATDRSPTAALIVRGSRYDAVLLLATAFAALAIGVEFAILVGSTLSVLWYLPRAARLKVTELVVSPERVVRERLAGDPPSKELLILDLEGELFFGAAPELERYLGEAAERARQQGIAYLVLRLKRVRNPDVVAIEVLEKFLAEAREGGLTVLLAGVRADLMAAFSRVNIAHYLSGELIFPEEDQDYSATLKAIRKAHELLARDESADATRHAGAYYLV